MNRNIPVFFVHSGNQDYLTKTIIQAEKTNNAVYLLGDDSNRHIAKNWANIQDYTSSGWEEFQKTYVHMSTNPYMFELNCFRRFFISYEFAKASQIDAFVLLDSDCFAFVNFSQLNFCSFDAGLSMPENQSNYIWTASPHSAYWTLPALKDFLEYLQYEYTRNLQQLEEKWAYHQSNNIRGGICDMTLLYLWATAGRGFRVLNTTLGLDGGIFDHFLSVSEGYSTGEYPVIKFLQMKRIKFQNSNAYFKRKDGNWIQAYTIHAQGTSKLYIPLLSRQESCLLYYFAVKAANIGFRILRKLRGYLQ